MVKAMKGEAVMPRRSPLRLCYGFMVALEMVALGLFVGVTLTATPARAAPFSSAFVVADLPVDATGKSGVAARDAARAAGEKQALQLVLQRLTAPQDWPRLPNLSGEDVTDLVLDFEVETEHASASHYLGRYTFRFDPKGIRALLQGANIPFTELVSKRVVAIPLYQDASGTHLWDDPNPWRDAWNAAHGPAGLVPWVVPAGDLGDVQSLDVPDLQHPTPDRLTTMSNRYGGGDVVIASAVEQQAPATPAADGSAPSTAVTLQITVTRYGLSGTDSESTSVSGEKPDAAFFLSGVWASEQMLEDLWKKESLAPAAPESASATPNPAAGSGVLVPPGTVPAVGGQQIEVQVPIASAADWVKMRDKIAQVSGVLATKLEVMTKDTILLQLSVSGETQNLALAFAQQDLTLTSGTNGGPLILRPRVIGDAAPTPQTLAPQVLGPQASPASAPALVPLQAQNLGAAPLPPSAAGDGATPLDAGAAPAAPTNNPTPPQPADSP